MYEESLTIRRRLGNQSGIAMALSNMGEVALIQGDYAAAQALYEESLTIMRQLGEQQSITCCLEGLAGVALGQGRPLISAQLLGGAAAMREANGNPLAPADREEVNRRVSSVREALGEEAFAAAWDAGRAMTLEQAAEYALSEGGERGDAPTPNSGGA